MKLKTLVLIVLVMLCGVLAFAEEKKPDLQQQKAIVESQLKQIYDAIYKGRAQIQQMQSQAFELNETYQMILRRESNSGLEASSRNKKTENKNAK